MPDNKEFGPLPVYDPKHPEHHKYIRKIYGPYQIVRCEVPQIPDINFEVFSQTTKKMTEKLIFYFDQWVKLPLVIDEHENHADRRDALEMLHGNGFKLTAETLNATRLGINKMSGVISFTSLAIDSLSSHEDLYKEINKIWDKKLYDKDKYDGLPNKSEDGNELSKVKVVDDLEDRVLEILHKISDLSHGILPKHQGP